MVSYLGFLGEKPNRGYSVGSYITEEKIPALLHPTPFAWGGPFPGVDTLTPRYHHLGDIFRTESHWPDGERLDRRGGRLGCHSLFHSANVT